MVDSVRVSRDCRARRKPVEKGPRGATAVLFSCIMHERQAPEEARGDNAELSATPGTRCRSSIFQLNYTSASFRTSPATLIRSDRPTPVRFSLSPEPSAEGRIDTRDGNATLLLRGFKKLLKDLLSEVSFLSKRLLSRRAVLSLVEFRCCWFAASLCCFAWQR